MRARGEQIIRRGFGRRERVRAFPNHHTPPLRLPILVLTKGRLSLTGYVIRVTRD